MRRTLPDLASLLLLALATFGAWMHWAILDPRNIGWLLDGNDRGQNSLGLIAYLRSRPPWPSLHDPLLMAPEGLSVALTDSNPLLAALLRPFVGWLLPDGWQYAGLWLLVCVCLQVAFAWMLVRPFASDRGAALLGTGLLAATPVLFVRYGHINLCAQWLILWALWVYLDDGRCRSAWRWAAVIGVAALVHPYLLVMVAAIWASGVLRLFVAASSRRLPLAATALLPAVVLLAVPALLGFFDEPLQSTGSYGAFGMAADGLWNPGDPIYSRLLPAAAPNASQAFEGFNYMGAGLIALVVLVIVVHLVRNSEARGKTPSLQPLLWLLPAFAVLAAIASGGRLVWQGQVIAGAALPESWTAALDPLRASGRMFWPALYTIVFAAVAHACRLRGGRVLLLLVTVIQIADFAPTMAAIRAQTARADNGPVFARSRDPRWSLMVARASAIEFYPAKPYREMALVEELAWRAISACRPVPLRWFYASRVPRSLDMRLRADRLRFEAGQLDPTRLYVLLNAAAPRAVAARTVVLDGITVVPPAGAAPPSTCISASSPRSAS